MELYRTAADAMILAKYGEDKTVPKSVVRMLERGPAAMVVFHGKTQRGRRLLVQDVVSDAS